MRKSVVLLLCSVSLVSCSSGPENATSAPNTPPPPGEIVVVNHGLNAPPPQDESTVMAPAALKPDETALPPQTAAVTVGAPQPLTDVAATPVTEAGRIAQLEKEVAALRADYNAMMPAFNGLITTNERIQSLLDQLEQKAGMTPAEKPAAASVPAPSSAPAPEAGTITVPAPEAAAPAAAPEAGAAIIGGLRVGEHGDKTRLVFDASAITDYNTDVRNGEKLLLITLPKAGWAGKASADKLKSPLIAGWTTQATPDGLGTVVAVRLKKDVKIVATERLKAEGKTAARIVLDLAADKAAS